MCILCSPTFDKNKVNTHINCTNCTVITNIPIIKGLYSLTCNNCPSTDRRKQTFNGRFEQSNQKPGDGADI